MDPLSYFETATSKSALNRHKHKYPPLHQRNILPAASGWGRRELFESRVVVGGSRHNVLPYRASSSEGFLGPPDCLPSTELSKIIDPLHPGGHELTETELVHLLGGTAGMFWAALHRFTGPRSLQSIMDSSDDVPRSPPLADADDDDDLPRTQRTRRQAPRHPGYVDSSHIKITSSSSPTQPSNASTSDHTGYISSAEHNRRSISEDATVELASAFLRHVLIHCPLQHVASGSTTNDLPLLLEYSGVRRRMATTLKNGALKLEATADGEIALLRRFASGHFEASGEVLALLEAKKQFTLIRDGRPVVTDYVLGQIVGEALALRLFLSKAELPQSKELAFFLFLFVFPS